MGEWVGARELVATGEMEIGLELVVTNELLIGGQDVTESGKVDSRSFGQGNTAGVAAGSCADSFRFKQGDGFGWSERLQLHGSGEPSKTATHHREFNRFGKCAPLRPEIDAPRPVAPVLLRIHHSSRSGGWSQIYTRREWLPKLAQVLSFVKADILCLRSEEIEVQIVRTWGPAVLDPLQGKRAV